MTLRPLPALALSLALAGCAAVGPDYHVPENAAVNRPTASAGFLQARETAFRQDAVPGTWWRLYQDPALDALIGQALQANTDLRIAAANLQRAQAATREARGQQQPTVGVNASPTFGHASGVQAGAPDTRPTDRWSYSSGISVAYQVDLFGQIRRAIEAASGDEQAAQAAYDAARVTVAAETAHAYADICAAGMELASARHSVDLQRDSLDAVQQLQQAGRGTVLDVTRARSQLEQLQAELPPFQASQRTALYRLAALTGHTPADMSATLLDCAHPPRLAQPIPVGDGAALLRRRPDIRQAERALAAATARIGVATADLYPTVTLGLSGGSAGPASIVGERGTFSWSVGPLISWTLPNTGAAQARIAQAQAGAGAALARFDATVLGALRETESALVTYARQLDRDAALQAARDQSALAASQAEQLFRAGKTDYLTMLDAQRTLASNESALAASQAALSTDQIALFLALGGGWQDPPAAAAGA
ncbi:efflux transporter outer membrane subunit [Bordetella sp. BOR01]|uniref:efflux transporter outer membrane subunit n=1 Tax=Bordetella sp. BOR01 TaxID=2854779 RepID=UPI001C489641|nr:efflux transporter outer membrane subunit [Bordetella sp. BOR01]MBV7485858.1 efflux transporter outer membrane subunit [Bordetella sp. BOR01]